MNRKPRILAVNGVPVSVLRKSNWSAPATEGEVAADTAAQAAHRDMIARKCFIEREVEVKNYLLHSFGLARDRKRQLEISRELDELEAELNHLREKLGATGDRRRAGSEQVVKTDRQHGADALNAIMHAPSIKKSDLSDPFELSNGLGLRSQTIIK